MACPPDSLRESSGGHAEGARRSTEAEAFLRESDDVQLHFTARPPEPKGVGSRGSPGIHIACHVREPLKEWAIVLGTRFAWGKFALPLAVFAVGAVLSLALGVAARQEITRSAQQRFDASASDVASKVEGRFDDYIAVLAGLRARFSTPVAVTRSEFRDYIAGLNLTSNYPGFQAVNYAPYVAGSDKQRFEEQIRSNSGPDATTAAGFAIKPPGERAGYYPMTLIEPLAGSEKLLGNDLGAVPAVLNALEQARDTGGFVTSGRKIRLPGRESHVGLAVRLPVYRPQLPLGTIEQRRAAYLGSVGAAFSVTDMMRDVIADREAAPLRLRLIDAGPGQGAIGTRVESRFIVPTAIPDAQLLFDNAAPTAPASAAPAAVAKPAPRFERTLAFELGGRSWWVEVGEDQSQVVSWIDRAAPWFIIFGGLAISSLLAGIVYSLTTSRSRAQALAKVMTRQLRTSERHLEEAQHLASLGSWILDAQTGALDCSDEARRILGFDGGAGLRDLPSLLARVPAEERAAVEQQIAQATNSGPRCEFGHSLALPDGTERWVHVIVDRTEEDGKPVLRGVVRDDTQRHRAALRLALEHQIARLLLGEGEMASVIERALEVVCTHLRCDCAALWRVHADGLVRCTATWQAGVGPALGLFIRSSRALNYRPDEGSLGRAWAHGAPLHIDVRSAGHHCTRAALAGQAGLAVGLIVPMTATGTSIALEFFSHHPRRADADTLALLGVIALQIAQYKQRKQAEAEAQRSSALLRGSIEAIDEAFALYDPDTRLVFCNAKYSELFDIPARLTVPGTPYEALLRYSALRGRVLGSERGDEWVAEHLAARRTGNTTRVQRLSDGRVVRLIDRRMPDGHSVGFRIDITELVRATEAAQAASVAKSQFLANMSHEIRSPMNAILGMLALLRKTELSARQADYASKTDGAARSLLGLLNDVLDFSKAEAGKMALDPQPFRVDHFLRDLSVDVSANASPDVDVLFDIDPALPRLLVGDAMRLRQVLINLCGNATKFTAAGEVVLSMAVLARDAAGVTLEIAVRDTGIGIAAQSQAHIFSGFTQAEASTTRRFGGTGLGLAISQHLVALMGGEIKLDSALGQGSRFHFCITLPVAAEAADEAAHDQPALAAPAAPLRVLIADDNPTAREVLQRMGRSLGWAVDVAGSGEQALEVLQAQAAAGTACQAIFIDWRMPGLDGWQTSRRIRELGLPAAPVVVMLAVHDREMLEQGGVAEQALIDGFLVKPVTASMLLDAIVEARCGPAQPQHPQASAGGQRLAGMRVLVAEDNPNNQQVARELLESEGALVQIAQHGEEAVAAVAAATPAFDIVLMDLQMPVMDGLTATRRIRQDLGLLALPIVAVTANAMAADREACLAAGMGDHVGKPFDLDHLVHVLCKHTGRDAAAEGTAGLLDLALPATVREAAAKAGVEIDAALSRLGGKRDLYQRVLRTFVKDLATMPEQLQAHAAQGQAQPASRLLHTLKGLAATLGAIALSAEAARGEKQLAGAAAPVEAADVAERACAAIATAGPGLAALLAALQAVQAAGAGPGAVPGTAPATTLDTHALQTLLRAMAGQLRNADMAATDAMAELQRQFGAALGEQLRPMDEAIDALDFERALSLCNALANEWINELADGQPA